MSIWQSLKSVLAAFFGVQSTKQRERDFEQGKFSHFVVIGLILTLGFIAMVWGGVQLMLHLLPE